MEAYEALDTIAGPQYGLVTLPQLLQLGFRRGHIREMVARRRLVLVRQGIYRLCGSPLSWRARALAAVLAAGPEAALSHRSAGILWGLLDRQGEKAGFEITRPGFARINDVQLHRHRLTTAERTVRLNIPVTSAARTLLDLCESMNDDELGSVCDEALRRRLVTLGELAEVLERHRGRGRRRLGPMRDVLADRDPAYRPGANRWEQEMDRMWERMGLPPAVRQYSIRTRGHLYIPDRAIVELKIAVDWNGYEYHGSRSRFDYDSTRRAELAAAGWYPLDFTAKSSLALICKTVLAVVEERRRLFGLTA
jgi:hypothetical protein